MQQPDLPSIVQEANRHPALVHLDLSVANIEVGEEELTIDPDVPWYRKLWVRAFAVQLWLSIPAHRYFGLNWNNPLSSHLSKTVVPVRIHHAGASVALPDRDKFLALVED